MSDIKRILVTGNGFDLYHCLPTAYKDFMDVVNRLLYLESKSTDPLFLKYRLFSYVRKSPCLFQ